MLHAPRSIRGPLLLLGILAALSAGLWGCSKKTSLTTLARHGRRHLHHGVGAASDAAVQSAMRVQERSTPPAHGRALGAWSAPRSPQGAGGSPANHGHDGARDVGGPCCRGHSMACRSSRS